MGNLLRTESWHRKLKLRYGQTIYFNNGRDVEKHYVLSTYYGKLNGKLIIHTRSANGEHHIETKWGLAYLGSYYTNVLMQQGDCRSVGQMRLDKYAKLHTAAGKAGRDQPMDFWEAGRRGCTIIPRYKKVHKTKVVIATGNRRIDRVAGEGLRAGELVFAKQEEHIHYKQFENRMFCATAVPGAASPNVNTHEGCPCCEANKR